MNRMPYPGLRPFRRDEADIFFGREEQVEDILEKLGTNRFLALVGASGCGKSSLAGAGILPGLELGLLEKAGENWRIAQMRPGSSPVQNLAGALLADSALERGPDEKSLAFLMATLQRGPLGLIEALRETPLPDDTNLLILVDQFEEIFRYRQADIDQAEAFVDLLLASPRQENIYVVITMRSDFLGDCALFPGLPEAMNESQFLTPRLTRDQRRGAIMGPASMFGGRIEPDLVNRLLNDMGADPDQLPVLQHVLMRMWTLKVQTPPSRGEFPIEEKIPPREELPAEEIPPRGGTKGGVFDGELILTLDDYTDIGGMKQALSNHADDAYNELSEKQKDIAKTLFKCLCERSDHGRDTRRPVELSEVAGVAGVSEKILSEVVDVFRRSDRSFLNLNRDNIIDISHESLIRQWKKLEKWVDEESGSAETYQRLEQTARLWKKEKAALWGMPDLDNALRWKEKHGPTCEWALRYGKKFDVAMEFLDESEKQRDEETRKQEDARKQELRRTRKQLMYALLGLVVAVFLAFWGFSERNKAIAEKKNAEKEKNRAETIEADRTSGLFESYLTHASLQAKIEDYGAARKILNKSRDLDSEIPAERRHARNLLAWYTDLMGGTAEQVYEGAGVPLMKVAVSPDGKLPAAVGEKGTVVLFDVEIGKLIKRLEGHNTEGSAQESSVMAIVFHPEGKWLATASKDQRIIFWSISDGEIIREIEAPDKVSALALSHNSKLLASSGTDNHVTIWDAESGKKVQTLKGHSDSIQGLAFSPDGSLLASASYDDTARIWDVKTGKSLHVLRGHANRVENVAFHPNGEILATCSSDKNVILWEVETGKPIAVFQGHTNAIVGITFTGSGNRLITASMDRTLRIWDTDTGVTLRVLQGHEAGVSNVAVMGSRIFSASNDGTVRRWDMGMEGVMRVVDMPSEPASSAISQDGFHIAIGFANGELRLYNLPEVQQILELSDVHSSVIQRLAFSPDGKFLASASFDNTVKLWQVSDGKLEQTFKGHTDAVHGIDFSPDGNFIATASYDGRIGLFEIGKEEGRFHEAHDGNVNSVAFDADGKLLISAGDDGKTRLWDIQTWPPKLVRDFPKSSDNVLWAAMSPDGSRVARVGRTEYLRIFNTIDGSEDHTYIGHENMVYRVAFSLDGGQVATLGGDGTVRLWDLTAGEELFTLQLPEPMVNPGPWDFDFRCTPTGCWIAVPLTRGKLVVYRMGEIYD